jgi:dTMP kinase
VFEGTDGAGKTTLINLTAEYLSGVCGAENIILTKQPTDMSRNTKLFQKMMYCKSHEDIDYRAVQLLTMSDRIQHGFEQIEPALRSGKTVICDRYIYTSLANMLARGYAREDWFFKAAQSIVKPNITFLAYVPPELAISRIRSRPEESRRHLDEGQLIKTSAEFIKMSKRERFTVLDTSGEAERAFAVARAELDKLADSHRINDVEAGGESEWKRLKSY